MMIHAQKIYSCSVEYKSANNIFVFTLCTLSINEYQHVQLTIKQSTAMATMEETGVQNNDEGPHEQKKPCSANYTVMEDVMVTMAYFKASEDSICGAKQKGHTFRSKIELAYNTIKKQQEEKEAQDLL